MNEENITWFRESEVCRDCPHLEECRETKRPRRTSCWIRHCQKKYWEPQLGEKKE